jgi:hypothetical protein
LKRGYNLNNKRKVQKMKNYAEYFTVNMFLLMLLGIIIMPGIADTWYEGTKYIFRKTTMTCFYMMFMCSAWGFGFVVLLDREMMKK